MYNNKQIERNLYKMKKNYKKEIDLINKIETIEDKFNIFITYYELTKYITKIDKINGNNLCYTSFIKTINTYQNEILTSQRFASEFLNNLKEINPQFTKLISNNALNTKINTIDYLQPSRVKKLTNNFSHQAKFYLMIKEQLDPIETTLTEKFNLQNIDLIMKKMYTRILNSFYQTNYQNEKSNQKIIDLVNEKIINNIHCVINEAIENQIITVQKIKNYDICLYMIKCSTKDELTEQIIQKILLPELIAPEPIFLITATDILELSTIYAIPQFKIYSIFRKLLLDVKYYELKTKLTNSKNKAKIKKY